MADGFRRPLLAPSAWPSGWGILELNPAHVTEARRIAGRRRIRTDAIDLQAITDVVLSGGGVPMRETDTVAGELAAWAAHRARRVATRTATKNQLLGQLDRSFPGLTLEVFLTQSGRRPNHCPARIGARS